jgi:hypothetical protein
MTGKLFGEWGPKGPILKPEAQFQELSVPVSELLLGEEHYCV